MGKMKNIDVQIELWKKEHGDIFQLEIKSGQTAWLRKPSRKELSMARSIGGQDEIAVGELIMDACWLGGDEEIKTNDDLFLSALPTLNKLVDIQEATLKKI